MTALALVPDPKLLGTEPNYPQIQQDTENRGLDQIQKFYHICSRENKHTHLGE